MAATTVYLVRHGEATDEDDSDPALSPLGRAQARRVGEALRAAGAERVLHSSRRRAVETAQLIAESLGNVDAAHSAVVEDRTPIPVDWTVVPGRYHDFLRSVPDDEADVGARVLTDAFGELSVVGDEDRSIIAVTHNFVIGWFVRDVLDAPWWRWIGLNQANGAITAIQLTDDREPRLVCFNEQGHLAGLRRSG